MKRDRAGGCLSHGWDGNQGQKCAQRQKSLHRGSVRILWEESLKVSNVFVNAEPSRDSNPEPSDYESDPITKSLIRQLILAEFGEGAND
jgi:hypothetical protein